MHVLLCCGKPDEEKAELCRKKTFLPLPWDGELVADDNGCCCSDLCVGDLLISRGTIIWQDGNPELQLVLTSLALGIQVHLVHGHLAFERMFYPLKLNCKSFHLQPRYIKQMTLCNHFLSALGL